MAQFKMGKEEKPRISKFYRVKMHTLYGDGCWDSDLLSTYYGMTAKEKKWAQKKADAITAKYDPSKGYKVKWARRHNSIHKRYAEVVVVEEKMGGIPVYL